MTDDIDPAAFDRWLVPGLHVIKHGNVNVLLHRDEEPDEPSTGWCLDVCRKVSDTFPRMQPVLRIFDMSGPVTALTLLHALHDRGMLRPEAYERILPPCGPASD